MKTSNILWLVAVFLAFSAGSQLSDLMNRDIDKTRRETIALQNDIVYSKNETIKIQRESLNSCVDIVIMCERLLIDSLPEEFGTCASGGLLDENVQ